MRSVITLSLAFAITVAMPQSLHAQGSVASGRRHAINWCTGCHAVLPDKADAGLFAADFVAIANLPSTTALSLKVFLRSSHNNMPNFILQPADADDIVAYILSLKRK